MARFASDGFIDGGLDAIATSTTLTVCAGQPTSIADIAARALASVAIDATDFAKSDGAPDGRQLTVAEQADLTVTGTGTQTADHVVVDNGTDYYVTTATPQALNNGGTVTVNSWIITVGDPTA